MQVLYTNEYMATHSLTGAKSSTSRDKAVKPAMNQNEVQEIIGDDMVAWYCHMNLMRYCHINLMLSFKVMPFFFHFLILSLAIFT